MEFKKFGNLKQGDKFIVPEIENHPYYITVWTKINDCYKYLSNDAAYKNNAESSYCYTAFGKNEMVIKLNEKESKEQQKIYNQWCTRYVARDSSELRPKNESEEN